MKRILTLLAILLATLTASADSFVRAVGQKLQGRDGRTLVMRGTNCGNWMIREPYMMLTGGNLNRQYKFDQMLREVCGEEKVTEFDRLWMDNNFREADMQFLSQQGFNTLRVPMHYKYFTLPIEQEPVEGEQTWIDEGFTRIDSMCVWAERYGILLILDMHACPGGQSDGDICDYDETKPSLWEAEANRTKLIALWRRIAERYKDEKCVAAYDLINETSWTLPGNQMLWDLQKNIIKAIREVDKNHIVVVEGNSWCNDYSGFPTTRMDSKMMLQFHRYNRYHTIPDEGWMTDMASKYNCPVYIGEFGENSNTYVSDAIRLYEEGLKLAAWTVWPMKKNHSNNTILYVQRVASYDNVIRQWQNGTKPSPDVLWNACKAWAEAQNIDRCTVKKDYLDALLRRPFNTDCIPYEDYQVGDYVYAAHYDMGACGRAYWDADDGNYRNAGEENVAWQKGWSLRNDGVDVYSGCNDTKSCAYYVGDTHDGEWLQYTIQNPNPLAKWSLQLRYSLVSGTSKVRITVNDRPAGSATSLATTETIGAWTTKNISGIILPQGTVRIRVYFEKGGANLNWLRFYSMKALTDAELEAWQASEQGDGNLLSNGDCELQGAWLTAAIGSYHSANFEWRAANVPSLGAGNALTISPTGSKVMRCVVYQPVRVEAGHTYQADAVVRCAAADDFWIQAFLTDTEPCDYADQGMEEMYTIGQLNTRNDKTLTTYDGPMSARAKAGLAHTAGLMTWKATTTGTVYFALKVGSSNASQRFTFDNITLRDLTPSAIHTPLIDAPLSTDEARKVLHPDGQLRIIKQGREYDVMGREQLLSLMGGNSR